MRRKILLFVVHKIFRKPEGEVMNKFCRGLYIVLYPLKYSYEKQSGLRYDFLRNCYFIDEIRYSVDIFKWFGKSAKDGELFMFVNRKDGVLTIKSIAQPVNADLQ